MEFPLQQQVMSPRTIIPFSGDDEEWDNWSFSYEAFAAGLGLIEHLLGNVPRPAEAGEGQNQWDAAQRSLYVSCMRKEAVGIIRGAPRGDGAGAWRLLTERFNSRSAARISILQAKFYDPSEERRADRRVFGSIGGYEA